MKKTKCAERRLGMSMVMLVGFSLTACATTELTAAGADVAEISESMASECEFKGSVSANNMNTLASNPEADARARAFNKVAELGGNSLRIMDTEMQVSSSGVGGIFSLTGEAYLCE